MAAPENPDAASQVIRWDPHDPLRDAANLWGEALDDVRTDLAGLPTGIEPVALIAPPSRVLAVGLFVPAALGRSRRATLARFAFPPGVPPEEGEQLVRWAEARARADRAAGLDVVERSAPGIAPLLEARGYALTDAMVRMRRTRPRPVPPLAGGLADVPVRVAGVDAWVRAYNASFASVPFSAPTTREECEAALRDPGHDPDLVRLVLDGAEAVAFLDGVIHADGMGEVRTIGVVPHAQGRGLGRWTLRRCEELLDARGVREVILRVAETNRTARALYLREGYLEVSRNRAWSTMFDGSSPRRDGATEIAAGVAGPGSS